MARYESLFATYFPKAGTVGLTSKGSRTNLEPLLASEGVGLGSASAFR